MAPSIEPHQQTLKRAVSCCGVGLHTGRTVNLTIKPAAAHSGIRFLRSDLPGQPVIPARVEQVVDTTLATTIGMGSARIATTEHLLAALRGSGIDNAEIDLDSHEVPIMDGSAGPFVHLLKSAGVQQQRALRRILRITRPISFADGDKSIRIEPHNGFRVTGRIHFDDALIREQRYSVEVTAERFAREIAAARTFGFVEQVEYLWQNGLALGGNLGNVIAIHWDRRSILNEDGLRFDDEFIRHKVLDVIGLAIAEPQPPLIADALQRLVEDPELRGRLGAQARVWAKQTFTIESNAARMAELYQAIVSRAARR